MNLQDPIAFFSEWLGLAKATPAIAEPTAMCLATATQDGKPSARMVLLKAHDEHGFVFYTNLESRKGGELAVNPNAALCFHWMPLERQVRIEGHVAPVSKAEADAYFASRPRDSQIGAWASDQSRPLASRDVFEQRVSEAGKRFEGVTVPRPPHWSGFRLIPTRMEFWQQGAFRLHERRVYTRNGQDTWDAPASLFP